MTVLNIALATEAGVSKKIKTGDSPLRIYDTLPFHTVDAGEPKGASVIRTRNKVTSVAGVIRRNPTTTISHANPY
jgi:hypothetical protein